MILDSRGLGRSSKKGAEIMLLEVSAVESYYRRQRGAAERCQEGVLPC